MKAKCWGARAAFQLSLNGEAGATSYVRTAFSGQHLDRPLSRNKISFLFHVNLAVNGTLMKGLGEKRKALFRTEIRKEAKKRRC